jgi:hypothetical protein
MAEVRKNKVVASREASDLAQALAETEQRLLSATSQVRYKQFLVLKKNSTMLLHISNYDFLYWYTC